MTCSASIVRSLVRAAREAGLAPEDLLRHTGMDLARFDDPDARLSTAAYLRAFRAACDTVPGFVLQASEATDVEALGVVGLLADSCETVGDAVRLVGDYGCILCLELRLELQLTASGEALMGYTMNVEPQVPALFEMMVIVLHAALQRRTGGAFRARAARFRHSPHAAVRSWLDPLPIEAGAIDGLVCDPAMLDLRLSGSDPTLRAILERHASRRAAGLPNRGDLVQRTKRAIQMLLRMREISVERVAREVGLSPRSLQRNLRARGTDYRRLLRDTRHELAEKYLCETELSIAEVSFLLGYADRSAFHHAFQRWAGVSPTTARLAPGPVARRNLTTSNWEQ